MAGALFIVFILPTMIAWILNLFLSKRKRFSFSCDRFSPLGLYIKNSLLSFKAKYFRFTVTVKKISIHTNFKNSLLSTSTSSPFILDIDSLGIEIVPEEMDLETPDKNVGITQSIRFY